MISKRGRRSSTADAHEADNDHVDAAIARFADAVEAVRARTSGPLVTAGRALVYGLVIATAAVGVLVLVAIAAIRALDIVVPGEVWSAYLIGSGAFGLAGVWAWSKRRPRTARGT